jgi:hypothetical protein
LNPVGNVCAYLRADTLAITAFDICDACCTAWNFCANDPKAIASMTSHDRADVN